MTRSFNDTLASPDAREFVRRARPAAITLGIVALALIFLFARFEPRVATSVLLSGFTLGALYFLVACGLSLIFGLMDVLNFAHGLLFMVGAYLGYTLATLPVFASLDSNVRFGLALLCGAVGGAVFGGLIEMILIRPLYKRPLYQVLLTLGLVFVGAEVVKAIWGTTGYFFETPTWFNTNSPACPSPDLIAWLSQHCSSVMIVGRAFPTYRLFVIGLGIAVFVTVALVLRFTRIGIVIRAGVDDREMAQALGIDVQRVFTLVFAAGCGLAGLGGVAAAPIIGVNLGIGNEFLLQSFIAVVIGGMGSFVGAGVGALIVGLARAVGDQLVLSGVQLPFSDEVIRLTPSIARASTVLIMAVVLLIRPAGLFGKK